jgi:hypothetical protein
MPDRLTRNVSIPGFPNDVLFSVLLGYSVARVVQLRVAVMVQFVSDIPLVEMTLLYCVHASMYITVPVPHGLYILL